MGCRAPPPRPHPESGRGESTDTSYVPDQVMAEGDVLEGNGFTLAAIATPGHALEPSLLRLGRRRDFVFGSDHVSGLVGLQSRNQAAGRARTPIIWPRLEKLRQRQEDKIYWPGHGGPVTQPQRYVKALELASTPARGGDRDGGSPPATRRSRRSPSVPTSIWTAA